tara:strand:+ start:614 stop:1183 length:570 start_codon:yes stop_codon:yes gene_type:complete
MRIYPQLTKIPTNMKASNKIIEFIKSYETLHDGDLKKIGLQPKLDGAGIWTEGYGHAMTNNKGEFFRVENYPTIESVLPYSLIATVELAEYYLKKDIERFEGLVRYNLKVTVTQNQFDALLSHAFNCGISSTMYRLVNSDASKEEIKEWFTTKYITSGGIYMKGLQYRRNDEWEIYQGINYDREYKLSV